MLKRTLEPEVMDTPAEAIAYDDMNHREVNELYVQDFLAVLDEFGASFQPEESEFCEILDLGTGTARIPILLCNSMPAARVFAVDASVEMLEVARLNIEISSNTDRIMLGLCDVKKLEMEDQRFCAVISNSIIHHIPDPRTTFAEATRLCRTGGVIFFRDLLRPASDAAVNELVATYAGDEADHARQMFDDSLRAAFTLKEIVDFVAELGFSPETVQQTSDRHWTWCAIKQG